MNITSLGKDPITPDQPTGMDTRYEPEFEQLQAEIDKISIPSASGGINWNKASDLASTILSGKSKDLLAASYLAVSQVHIRQLDGLNDGLIVLHDLIDTYWEDLFPPKKRLRGRLGAIEWWIEKTETALKTLKPVPVEAEILDSIQKTLSQVETLLQSYLPEPPLLRPIQRILEQIPTTGSKKIEPVAAPINEAPTPEPPKTETELEEAVSKTSPATDEPTALNTEQDIQKALSASIQRIRQVSTFLLEHDLSNPLAYRYRRVAAWMQIVGPPPASSGQTQIPPPAPQVQQTLMNLREKAQWNAFIINVEQRLSQFIFWLDLNRWVAEALVQLGDDYRAAHDAVCQETAFLVSRISTLMDLSFSDETPFADAETRQWLEGIRLGNSAGACVAASFNSSDPIEVEADHLSLIQSKAQALAKKKKWLEAVGLFQVELKKCSSQKEALAWRMALCRIMIGSKRADMIKPHLDLILDDIETYRLETWDPALALEGLKLVFTGHADQTDPLLKQKANTMLSRIAKLDPTEALKLGSL